MSRTSEMLTDEERAAAKAREDGRSDAAMRKTWEDQIDAELRAEGVDVEGLLADVAAIRERANVDADLRRRIAALEVCVGALEQKCRLVVARAEAAERVVATQRAAVQEFLAAEDALVDVSTSSAVDGHLAWREQFSAAEGRANAAFDALRAHAAEASQREAENALSDGDAEQAGDRW